MPNFQEIHPASRLDFPAPHTLGAGVCQAFAQHPAHADLPAAALAVLPAVRIYGRRLAVINANDQVIASVSREYSDPIEHHFVFTRARLPRVHRLAGTTCFLACNSGNNYYHWLFDCIPILDIMTRGGAVADHFVFTGVQQPFQRDMLAALGIPLDKIVETDRVRHIEAEKLILPAQHPLSGGLPRWACDFLRDKVRTALLPGGPRKEGRRLYISREDAGYRKITNAHEVEALLQRYRFEKIVPGKLTVREQIEALAGAAVVVGPHGAGLANLAFAPKGAQVVELFAPGYVNPCYYELCCTAGHDYHYLLGETQENDDNTGEQQLARQDMTLSVEKLDALLKSLAPA